MYFIKTVFFFLAFVSITSCNYLTEKNSNEVIGAFGQINESLESANNAIRRDTDSLLLKAIESFPSYKTELKKVLLASEQLNAVIDSLKLNGPVLNDNYQDVDSSTYFDELFFEGPSITVKGKDFVNVIEHYAHTLHSNFNGSMPQFLDTVLPLFSTNRINGVSWLAYSFKGIPAIVTTAKLTKIQSDVLRTNKTLVRLLSQI